MMQASLNIKFGYPNNGLTLRWGESRTTYAQVRRGWQDTFEPMLGAQVIIGNQSELARQVLLVWTILGKRKTTIVNVPPLGNPLGSTIGDIGRPSDWVPPDPATANFGEASVWLDMGRCQNRNPATCMVELPVGGLSLSREITCTDNGAFDQIGDEWQEVNREETSSSHGDTSTQWPSKITMQLPPSTSSAPGQEAPPRTMNLVLAKPMFPPIKDPLGGKFAQIVKFTENSSRREYRMVNLTSDGSTKAMWPVKYFFVSPDRNNQRAIVLVFGDPPPLSG